MPLSKSVGSIKTKEKGRVTTVKGLPISGRDHVPLSNQRLMIDRMFGIQSIIFSLDKFL